MSKEEKQFMKNTQSSSEKSDEIDAKEAEEEIYDKDHQGKIMEIAAKELSSKNGKEPVISEIESFKEDYLHNEDIDNQLADENNMISSNDIEDQLDLLNQGIMEE